MTRLITEPVESDIKEQLFGRMTEPQLRDELERYRSRWQYGRITWRLWKTAEKMIRGELRFRKLQAGELKGRVSL
jgi:hypothetical protein